MLNRLVDAIGGDDGFGQPPEVFAGHEFRRAKGQPGDGDLGSGRSGEHPFGMMRRRVVPDEQLRHIRPHLPQHLDKRQAIILAAALADERHQFTGRRVECAMHHPAADASADASADHHDRLFSAVRPS